MEYRIEHDSMGEMKVPADRYWGAQTQRSYENFRISTEKIPIEVIRAFGVLKKAAAIANFNLGKISDEKRDIICKVADEIVSGLHDDKQFPLAGRREAVRSRI